MFPVLPSPRYSCSCIRGNPIIHPASQSVPKKKRHPLKPKPRVPQKTFRRNRKKKRNPDIRKWRPSLFCFLLFLLHGGGPCLPPHPVPEYSQHHLPRKGYPKQPKPDRLRCACVRVAFRKKKGDKKKRERVIQASPRRITLGRISFGDSSWCWLVPMACLPGFVVVVVVVDTKAHHGTLGGRVTSRR